jgi:hypothetical protein
MKKSELKQIIREEIQRMQKLAGTIKEDMSIDDQGNLQVEYKFKIGQIVESYGDEIIHKILDVRPNWESVEEDPNDPEFIMRGTENTLDDENIHNPWYLVEPINTEEDGDYMFWWPEGDLELVQ